MMATELLDLACTAKPWLDEDTSPNEIAPLRLSFGGILSEDEDEYERQVDWERVNQEQVAWHLVVDTERRQYLSLDALSLFEIIKKGLKIASHKRRRALYLHKIPVMLKRHGRVGMCYGLAPIFPAQPLLCLVNSGMVALPVVKLQILVRTRIWYRKIWLSGIRVTQNDLDIALAVLLDALEKVSITEALR